MYLLKNGSLRLSCLGESCWRGLGAGGRMGRSLTLAIVLLPGREHNSCFWEVTVSLAQLRVNSCKLKTSYCLPCQYILKEFLIHKLLTLLPIIACLLWQHLFRERLKCKQQPVAFCSEVLPRAALDSHLHLHTIPASSLWLYMNKNCTHSSYSK